MTQKKDTLDWLAKLVAIEAPERGQAATAKIPWAIIERIRKVLEEQGFDWRHALRHRIALEEVRDYRKLLDFAVQHKRENDILLYRIRLRDAEAKLAKVKETESA